MDERKMERSRRSASFVCAVADSASVAAKGSLAANGSHNCH